MGVLRQLGWCLAFVIFICTFCALAAGLVAVCGTVFALTLDYVFSLS